MILSLYKIESEFSLVESAFLHKSCVRYLKDQGNDVTNIQFVDVDRAVPCSSCGDMIRLEE